MAGERTGRPLGVGDVPSGRPRTEGARRRGPLGVASGPFHDRSSNRSHSGIATGSSPRAYFVPEPNPIAVAFPIIELIARSYAPFIAFGAPFGLPGFEGDARGASNSNFATARVTSIATLDTAGKSATFFAFSNMSAWPAEGPLTLGCRDFESDSDARMRRHQFTATAKPTVKGTVKALADSSLVVTMSHAGALPLIRVLPDIDLHTIFEISLANADATVRVRTTMTGDAFPNAEAYARITGKNTCFIPLRQKAVPSLVRGCLLEMRSETWALRQ